MTVSIVQYVMGGPQVWEDGTRFVGLWQYDLRQVVAGQAQCFDADGQPTSPTRPDFVLYAKTFDDYFSLAEELWDVKYASHH
jgi:hypothetical protein